MLTSIPAAARAHLLAHMLSHAQYDPATDCIIYTGYKTPKGYGRQVFVWDGQQVQVRIHRAMWILTHGPISDERLVVDHLCGNRACMNPEHLELITNEENLSRGDDRQGRPRRKFGRLGPSNGKRRPIWETRDCCVHGHPWPEFLQVSTLRNGRRQADCSECQRIRKQKAQDSRAASPS